MNEKDFPSLENVLTEDEKARLGGEAMRGGAKRSRATLEGMKQALEGKLYIGKKFKKIVYFREGSTGPDMKRQENRSCYRIVSICVYGGFWEIHRIIQIRTVF